MDVKTVEEMEKLRAVVVDGIGIVDGQSCHTDCAYLLCYVCICTYIVAGAVTVGIVKHGATVA
jgi:hypothetical protein